MEAVINILFVCFFVFMNGFFVAAEFAMVKVRKSRIETLATTGNSRAKYTHTIVNDLNSYLSACQLGITLASLALGWLGEPTISKLLMPIFKMFDLSDVTMHSISLIIAFTIVTALHIVLGELVPKSLAIISSEKVAMATAIPLMMFYKASYPIMWTFNSTTSLMLGIFGISQSDDHAVAHTDEEIKLIVEESYKHGLIDKTELTFVDNIFDFSEKTAKEIMIPRTDMVCVYLEDSYEELMDIVIKEELTRYPVCDGDKDNIVGFVHIKDIYKQKLSGQDLSVDRIIRSIQFVPETMSISTLFKLLQKQKQQLAIVVDEYGGTSGLVTIEDILEEIVGKIQDEFDDKDEEIKKQEDGSYLVDGKVSTKEIGELLNIKLNENNIDTIGGWVCSKLETMPKANDKIQFKRYEFIIHNCDDKRVYEVLIKRIL